MKRRLLISIVLGLAALFFAVRGISDIAESRQTNSSNGFGALAIFLEGLMMIGLSLIVSLIAWILYRKQSR